MSISTRDADYIDVSLPNMQDVGFGTEVKSIQDAVVNIQAGIGITLPTSDPSVAGQLWSDSGTVKVSAG